MNREKSLEKAGGVDEMHCQLTARPIDAAEQYILRFTPCQSVDICLSVNRRSGTSILRSMALVSHLGE